ncbi:cytochrome c-type biogenesis protein CycL [Parvularcula bermudensis HTCC2503]|uniref:Cytochrome c-type biogenesis protein n=1 Tax=Parvularcula bermudensis (strain ATCC BAA-594 / HTCC2503 / KCTC 12087) TaxID=314260 RepID=E0TFV8_PARBH|nr:cytochrome c-type biogenesis protein [Parvularcula bermudensis]ADM09123.1 cytochrome c-type biogenesis protein CycL [Parvularcula bermudensis HTCC2503]
MTGRGSLLALLLGFMGAMPSVAAQAQEAQDRGGAPLSPELIDRRTQAVAETLRCVVCQNQSVADSESQLAQDMVKLIREEIAAGKSETEVRAYFAERYGEVVLLQPRFDTRNWGLWLGPGIALVIGLGGAIYFISTRSTTREEKVTDLSPADRVELAALRSEEGEGEA